MKWTWENNGEANEQGQFVAVIDLEDGKRPQRFIGGSHKEVSDKLLEAQAHASAKIAEQARELNSMLKPVEAKPATEFKRRPLSADERMQVAHQITDPAQAPEAIKTVVEAEVGAPLATVRERLQENQESDLARATAKAAAQFAQATPDWYPSDANKTRLLRTMRLENMDFTVAGNYALAWEQLKADGLMQMKPAEPDNPPEAEGDPAQQRRPRGVIHASGLRSSDSSGSAPSGAREPKPKYTAEQILNMPQQEYKDKMASEPGFAQLVDKMFAVQPAAAR